MPIKTPFDEQSLVGLQLNGGPIIAFSKENLTAIVNNDVDALEYVKKEKYAKAIKKFNQHYKKPVKK